MSQKITLNTVIETNDNVPSIGDLTSLFRQWIEKFNYGIILSFSIKDSQNNSITYDKKDSEDNPNKIKD
jgi:hypothetical protein